MAYLIGIDLGTTSIKCILLDATSGKIVTSASQPTPVSHPQPGWSEHDPHALWQAVAACLRQVCEQPREIAGLAISSMAEPGLAVDSGRRPLAPIIAWYDRRSELQSAWIEQQVTIDEQFAITGQRVSPSFAVTKILWMREVLPSIYRLMATWLPAPAYLLEKLCGRAAIDYTLAARTLLFDQHRLDWSDTLLAAFDLPRSILPEVLSGGSVVGRVSNEAAQTTGLPPGTPCVLGGHDHMCAGLATGAAVPGALVDSTGTAQALLMLLPHFLPNPGLAHSGFACSAYVLPGLFALKGGLKAAGGSLDWLVRQLTSPGQPPDYAELEKAAWDGVGKSAGPLWLPHLIGSGTPEGNRFSRAALVGVQFEHNRGDLFRGMLESLAFWLRHNVEEMSLHTGLPLQSVTLTGGVTRIRLLSQLKADILALPVLQPQIPETAAAGAALQAGLGTGVFANPAEACAALRYPSTRFLPNPERTAWYNELYQQVYRPLYASLEDTNARLQAFTTPGSFPPRKQNSGKI